MESRAEDQEPVVQADVAGMLRRALTRAWVAPALAVSAVAVALATQFAYTEHAGIPRLWLGFAAGALLLGGGALSLRLARPADGGRTTAHELSFTRRQEYALLAGIVLLGAFFRLFRFYSFPQGLWYDEGVNGLDAMFIIDKDHFTVWRETVMGRSTLYLYLLVGSFKIFGFNLFAFRILPVAAGLAAIPAFYFLARWLVGVVPALVATALFAVSRWAVTFSRISWEAALVPLLATMSVFFLVRAIETRNRFYYFMAGGSLAAGLYTHVSFRIVPVVMLFILGYIAVTQWRVLRSNLPGLVLYAVSFLVVVYPLAQFALTNQDKVLERTRQVNIFREIDDVGSYEPLRFNIRSSIKMMNVSGDRNGRHNIGGAPMLDEVTGALFVLGLAVSLWSARNWRRGSVAGWYALALVPGALTITIENPSAIRDIGALPPVYLLAGLAVATLYGTLATSRAGVLAFCAIAAALVTGSAAINYYDFFERQANDQYVYDGFTPEFTQVAKIVAAEADEKDIYVSRDFAPHPAIQVLGRGKPFQTYTAGTNVIFPRSEKDVLLVPDERQFGIVPTLERLYPRLKREDRVDAWGRTFFSRITIPASDVASLHELPATIRRDGGEHVTEERSRIDRPWTDAELAGGPLMVTWEGYYWSPGGLGTVIARLTAPGTAAIEIDGQRYDTLTGELLTPALTLVPGEHRVKVTAQIARAGQVALELRHERGVVQGGADALYGISAGDRGFRVLYRTGNDFAAPPVAIARLPFAVPADRDGAVAAIEYQGVLDVPVAGTYGFALDSGNSAQLFIDGQLIVDNGGAHPPRRIEALLDLTTGEHLVSIQYTIVDRPIWSLYLKLPDGEWKRADGNEFAVPAEDFRQAAAVTLVPDAAWGSGGRALEGAAEAVAVAVAPDGTLVVASPGSIAFVSADGTVSRTVDLDVRDIADVAVAPDGRVLALERESKSLFVLRPDGSIEGRIEGQFASALGIGIYGGDAVVASPAGGVLYRVRLSDGAVEPLPVSATSNPNRAIQPSDAASSPDKVLYVTDFESRSVVKSADGLSSVKLPGVGGTGAQVPRVTTYGKLVLVSDPVNQRIVIYDSTGKQRGVFLFPSTLEGIRPGGIAATADGTLYAADLEHGTVYRFRIDVPPEIAAELAQQ